MHVYILQSTINTKQIYTGFTTNVNRRLSEHNAKKSAHTSKYTPWKLMFCASFHDEKTARAFEKYLKSSSGFAFRNKHLL